MIDIHALFNPRVWESPAKPAAGILLAVILIQEWRKGYFRNFRISFKALLLRPYALILALFLPLFLFVFACDRTAMDKVQALRGDFWSAVLVVGRNIGENVQFWFLLILLYWMARACRSAKWASGIFGALAASSCAGLAAHIFKFIFMRARPYENAGPYSFFNYDEILHHSRAHQSLPSGDVALVSGAAAYFFFSVRNPFLRLMIFMFPLANAYARMSLNKHWPSDTVMAMGLGLMAAYFFWSFKESQGKSALNLSQPPASYH